MDFRNDIRRPVVHREDWRQDRQNHRRRQDLAAPPDLLATDAHEPIEQSLVQKDDLPSGGGVFPAAQGGLGAQGLS